MGDSRCGGCGRSDDVQRVFVRNAGRRFCECHVWNRRGAAVDPYSRRHLQQCAQCWTHGRWSVCRPTHCRSRGAIRLIHHHWAGIASNRRGTIFSDPEVLELDNEIATYFTSPNAGSLAIDSETGSSIYTLSGTENAIANAQRQVLLFNLTTAGDLSGRIPIQFFQQGLGDRAATRVFEFEGVGVYTGQPSCSYLPGSDCDLTIYGCLDSDACNYNPNAEADDGSCLALDACGVCGGEGTTCVGCLDPNACNYDADALFDDGSCASWMFSAYVEGDAPLTTMGTAFVIRMNREAMGLRRGHVVARRLATMRARSSIVRDKCFRHPYTECVLFRF